MNRVTLPLNYHNPNDDRPYFDWDDRVYKIRDAASIACITREIHDTHIAGEPVGLVVFNHPHRDRYSNPILSMESDWPGVDLSTHRRIALWVGNKLNRAYNCQVQIVWSGNVSYHIHHRINRRNMIKQECIAIQQCLTDRMERLVRKHFKLPKFVFDRTVTNRLAQVRLGDGLRVQVGRRLVNKRQKIKQNLDADFTDVATMFPVDDDMKKNYLRTTAVRQARSRNNRKIRVAAGGGAVLPLPPVRRLAQYSAFLRDVGSTVIPSHWGHKTLPDSTRVPVIVCYYSPRDPNPSCVLGLDSYFTTDSRDRKHPVGWSYNDYREAIANDLRANYIGTTDAIQDSAGRAS